MMNAIAGALVVMLLSCIPAPVAFAATTQVVAITLRDAGVDASHPGMTIEANSSKVKAGRVTFEAVNLSKDLVHEMLVIPAPRAGTDLPFDAKTDTVAEKRVHSLGEISELRPGARGKLTVKLRPGKYLLLCNQPGHYKAGMSTELVVE